MNADTMRPAPPRRFILVLMSVMLLAAPVLSQNADAGSAASQEKPAGILDFPGRYEFHKTTGWLATGLFFTAGAIGAWRAWDLMEKGHDLRDGLGIDDEDDSQLSGALASLYAGDQLLRWVHVGFLVAGETLYLGDAATGLAMKLPRGERTAAADIHLAAFFTHAALMATEVFLGVMTSDALRRGDHEAHIGLTVAHAAVGFAIPAVMAGAGLAETLDLSFLDRFRR